MSIKVLVAIVVMGIAGYLLAFVATPDSSTLLDSNTSLIDRSIIAAGFVLILPTFPFTLLVEPVLHKMGDAYSPGYSALLGIILSAIFWAILFRRTSRRFVARRSNQSLEPTAGRSVE